jgi:hypothetical protein
MLCLITKGSNNTKESDTYPVFVLRVSVMYCLALGEI